LDSLEHGTERLIFIVEKAYQLAGAWKRKRVVSKDFLKFARKYIKIRKKNGKKR